VEEGEEAALDSQVGTHQKHGEETAAALQHHNQSYKGSPRRLPRSLLVHISLLYSNYGTFVISYAFVHDLVIVDREPGLSCLANSVATSSLPLIFRFGLYSYDDPNTSLSLWLLQQFLNLPQPRPVVYSYSFSSELPGQILRLTGARAYVGVS